MKKLLLINPHTPGRHGEEDISVIVQMPLNLAYLAALTPDDWDIDVIDENMEPAIGDKGEPKVEDADLVAVTAVTYQASRAYQVSEAYRKTGAKVIMGGIHSSVMPDEVAGYVDCVFIGEADQLWGQVIKDFCNGGLKPRYDGGLPDLGILKNVFPDRELMRKKYNYAFSSVVTTKGCPNRCDFCSVPTFQKQRFRERPYEDVLDELAATDYKGLMFAEDNFYGHGQRSNERARNLFKGMVERGLKKDWLGFTALNVANDPVTLKYMAESGNFGMLIGIESTNPEVLRRMNKRINLRIGTENFKEAIKAIHDAGLIVWGSVVFGADGDGQNSFQRMVDFILENKIDILTFGIDCPFPNTPLFHRLSQEGRMFRTNFPDDWFYYDTAHLVHKLTDMTLEEFIDGMQYVYDNLYAGNNLRMRFRESIKSTHNPRNSMFAFRVAQDWTVVFQQVLDNLRKLAESGDYYRRS